MDNIKFSLLNPDRLCSRDEVLSSSQLVPKHPGIYAWYFKQIPSGVPTEDCHEVNGLTLLYVGISPKAPPLNGSSPSKENLFKRVRYHMRGNAEGSTLRLTLGCLLSEQLGIQLRRVGSGTRKTFSTGETTLSDWMSENAFVTWVACDEPWAVEEQIIPNLSLPLNLQHNKSHNFYQQLKAIRSNAKQAAMNNPIVQR